MGVWNAMHPHPFCLAALLMYLPCISASTSAATATATLDSAAASDVHTFGAPPPAFSVIWNGPSASCNRSPPTTLTLSTYGILANPRQAFNGSVITLLYTVGVFPKLDATYNATPCWTGKHPCSWNPWGSITASANGGVPQAANLTLHEAKLEQDVVRSVADPESDALLILDWEA